MENLKVLKEKVTEQLLSYFVNELDVDVNDIDLNAPFDKLGLDSIYFVKVIVDLEKIFDISFDDDNLALEVYENINSLIDYILKLMQKK